jgi:hypothetical protein
MNIEVDESLSDSSNTLIYWSNSHYFSSESNIIVTKVHIFNDYYKLNNIEFHTLSSNVSLESFKFILQASQSSIWSVLRGVKTYKYISVSKGIYMCLIPPWNIMF